MAKRLGRDFRAVKNDPEAAGVRPPFDAKKGRGDVLSDERGAGIKGN
jgi:hypothetical protein